MLVLKILFWLCLLLVFYTYLGYGILLCLLVAAKRGLSGRKPRPELPPDAELPEVTLMICAYNEEDIVSMKMENTRQLNYPEGKLKVLWVTDGSTDSTNERLKAYRDVQVVFSPERGGKTAALNHGIRHVGTPLVVMTDANTLLNADCIRQVVRSFLNPKVGCVAGEKRVMARRKGEAVAEGEGLYWK